MYTWFENQSPIVKDYRIVSISMLISLPVQNVCQHRSLVYLSISQNVILIHTLHFWYIYPESYKKGQHSFLFSCHVSQEDCILVYSISLHFDIVWIILYKNNTVMGNCFSHPAFWNRFLGLILLGQKANVYIIPYLVAVRCILRGSGCSPYCL